VDAFIGDEKNKALSPPLKMNEVPQEFYVLKKFNIPDRYFD